MLILPILTIFGAILVPQGPKFDETQSLELSSNGLNASIGFLILENVGLAEKIMCLDQLEQKLWCVQIYSGAELRIFG